MLEWNLKDMGQDFKDSGQKFRRDGWMEIVGGMVGREL